MFELRPYQKDFSLNLAKAVVQSKKIIACLPTGAGKTKIFISIANSAINKGRTVLIISESRKIFEQIQNEANGIEIKAGAQSFFGVIKNRIYVSMAQTLARRPLLLSQFHEIGDELLIIVDEAHIGISTKILKKFTNSLLIGFTATPDWNSAKHLPDLYNGIVIGPQVHDLIQDGYLCGYRHYARVGADMNKLEIKKGEFTEASQEAAFENKNLYAGLLEDLRTIKYKKAIIFCSSIKHCNDVADELEFNGLKCVKIHSREDNCSYELMKFETSNDFNICVSVGMLNKGYDHPAIDLSALLFATTSRPRYLQSIGRCSRLSEGKNEHICLDYGENYKRFGLWDADVPWETLWLAQKKKKKSDKVGVAPVKECANCQAIIPSRAMICPYCAEVQPQKENDLEEGELIEITEKYNALKGRKISDLTPEELATFAKLKNKRNFCIRVAKSKEQKHPGFLSAFSDCMQYKKGWLYHQDLSQKVDFYDVILK